MSSALMVILLVAVIALMVWLRIFAVAHLGGDVDLSSVADVHLLHGDDPALDEVAQSARQGHVTTAAVECRPIDGPARVMGGNHATGRRRCTRRVSLGQNLIEDAFWQRHHAVFL